MKVLLLFAVLALGCNDSPSPATTDLAAASPDLRDAGVSAGCSPDCSSAQFCYGGAETGFFLGDGGIQVGCNALPGACEHNCTCILQSFQSGFCSCYLDDQGVPTVHCSFA